MMLRLVQYRTKLIKSGIFSVLYWTEIMNAGMPMPALVCLMPMPSYAERTRIQDICKTSKLMLNSKELKDI
jgi:hypothetical protein